MRARLHRLERRARASALADALKNALWRAFLSVMSAATWASATWRARRGETFETTIERRRRRLVNARGGARTRARKTATASMDGPAHLIACAHGLAGTPEDLRALERRVAADGNALVHRLACNAPLNSFDGVEAGAVRIVEELREVVRANPSLRYLTLYGNSLGGIYARYAAGIMWEEKRDGTMLGLIPCTYLTTATPHLGVGPWGFFKLVPRALRYLWSKQLGRSIMELTLRDGEDGKLPLLARMADPETREPANFVAALGSFKRRCAYANATNDFLVSYETASLHPEYLDSAQERAWRCLDEPQIVEEFERDGEFAIEETDSASWSTDELALRRKMARGLRTLSWRHVNVSFPGPVPLAHNKICALQRNPYLASLFKEGEFIVDHQAEYLLASIRSV